MNWEAVGASAELLGALGVIASLVYLAAQIRQNTNQLDQNTRAVRTSAYHQANEQAWLANIAIGKSQDLAELMSRGLLEPAALDQMERIRFLAIASTSLFAFENTLALHEEGLIDDRVWKNLGANSLPYLRLPGSRWALEQRTGGLSSSVRDLVEASDVPPAV